MSAGFLESIALFVILYIIIKVCSLICKETCSDQNDTTGAQPNEDSGGFMTSRVLQPRNSESPEPEIVTQPVSTLTQMPMPLAAPIAMPMSMPMPMLTSVPMPIPSSVPMAMPMPYNNFMSNSQVQMPLPSNCPYPPQCPYPMYSVPATQNSQAFLPYPTNNLDNQLSQPPNYEEAMKMIPNQNL
ncbi:uncharacterized protein [Chironomus tepperi]|uniref:uncharacterized protein isoform X2 n=1 Tax=Chironomus tepperi TaxID=113505 RepID=UPI00391F7791